MKKRTNDDETVEAAAFVVTDPQGRRRVFIGDLAPEGEPWRPGVAIYDEDGSERVSLLLGDVGPVLSYAADGDTRLELGVVDLDRGGTEPGPVPRGGRPPRRDRVVRPRQRPGPGQGRLSVTSPSQQRDNPGTRRDFSGPAVMKGRFSRRLLGGSLRKPAWGDSTMPRTTHPDPGAPRRAGAGTRPGGRRPGRPSHPIRLLPARLVPLTPEHERAALAALAALLAADDEGGSHE